MKQKIKDFFEKNMQHAAVIAICSVIVIIIGVGITGTLRKASADKELLYTLNDTAASNRIFVHMKGAVVNEGLYELRRGDRMSDAITAAGGLAQDAAGDELNLAEFVEDGQKITIPSKNTSEKKNDNRININTAGVYELMTLPRVGETVAKRIVEYREANGNYTNVEQLKKVKGLGGKNFEQICDLVTTE